MRLIRNVVSTVRILIPVVLLATVSELQAQGFARGSCTGLQPADTGALVNHAFSPPSEDPLSRGTPIGPDMEVRTATNNRAALYLQAQDTEPSASVGLYMQPESVVHICPKNDARRRVDLLKGTMAVLYTTPDKTPLIIAAGDFWLRIEQGLLRIEVAKDRAVALLIEGTAMRFDGPLPESDPAIAVGGSALAADPRQRFAVMNQIIEPLTVSTLSDAASSWIARAEQGDFTLVAPPGTPAEAVVTSLSVRAPVDQAVLSTPLTAAAANSPVVSAVGTPTRVQSLLTSGNPASVVVGVRLQRTRIVGNPGTDGQGAGLRFNPEVRSPFGR